MGGNVLGWVKSNGGGSNNVGKHWEKKKKTQRCGPKGYRNRD